MSRMGEYDFSRLSDSRILYLRNPPRFSYIFVVAVVIVIAATLIWSSTAVRAEEIRASGMVVSGDSAEIVPQASGIVSAVNFSEGDRVKAGDCIVEMDPSQKESEKAGYEKTRAGYEDRLAMVDKLLDALKDNRAKQPFEKSDGEFYFVFEEYRNQQSMAEDEREKASIRYRLMDSMYSERRACVERIEGAANAISACEREIALFHVGAPVGGTLHFDTDVRIGAVLSSGARIGSLSSDDSVREITLYTSAADRPRMSVGQECRFTIDGLPQSEFGLVKGVVKSISSNATVTESGAVFKVVVGYEADYLEDSRGGTVAISDGMTVDVWIVYEKTTYLQYFKERFGLK